MSIKNIWDYIKSVFTFEYGFRIIFFSICLISCLLFVVGKFLNPNFMNFDQNWFDCISIFLNTLAILLAWFVSYSLYKKEKIDQEIEENKLLNHEVLFLKKNIERILPVIIHQINVFERFPNTNQFNRTISIDTSFMSYFDLKNFYTKISIKEKDEDKLNILNDLLLNLGRLDNYYEKEKTVFLAFQKIINLAPQLNVAKTAVKEKVSSYIKSNKYSKIQINLLNQYLTLLNNIGMDFKKFNADCDLLTMNNVDSYILFEIDDNYRRIRTDFTNSEEDFNNEFGILKSNLKDAKESIEKYLN